MLLQVDRAIVHYKKVAALKGISMAVPEGGIVTIIGANGAGKSTTLRAISGLTGLTSGEIRYDGHRIDGPAPLGQGTPRGLHRRPQAHGGGVAGGGPQGIASGQDGVTGAARGGRYPGNEAMEEGRFHGHVESENCASGRAGAGRDARSRRRWRRRGRERGRSRRAPQPGACHGPRR
ncbi:MAG: ATP-binding cassette domain-containing protein [Proteobacteria bacterium]|nr:ATP-binding cassette domain-containing protein [Pseudomonadota bacterium]